MFELEHIGLQVLLKFSRGGILTDLYFIGCVIDVKDTGYVVEVEERASMYVPKDRLVDLDHDRDKWKLSERMF